LKFAIALLAAISVGCNGAGSSAGFTPTPEPSISQAPSSEPLRFIAPEWMDGGTATAYSQSLDDLVDKGTLSDIPKIIAVEFIDLQDGTYVAEIQFVYDYSSDPCRGGAFESYDLFVEIMTTVPFDFGTYTLDTLRILARAPGADDFGNPGWVTVKGTSLSRKDFSQIDWNSPDIQYGINWDKLGETKPCN
jgi:hypothetical protein